MATKHQVIDLHRQRPDYSARDIAAVLGCHDAYVRKTAARYGLKLRRERTRTSADDYLAHAKTLRDEASRLMKAARHMEARAVNAKADHYVAIARESSTL